MDTADLKECIRLSREVVRLTPQDALKRVECGNDLGLVLREWFNFSGDEKALDAAISAFEECIQLIPNNSPQRPVYINNLGASLMEGYYRLLPMHPEYLDKCVDLFEAALKETQRNDPERRSRLFNLATVLLERFQRDTHEDDLQSALSYYEDSISATPAGSPTLIDHLHGFGIALRERFHLLHEVHDLERSIEAYRHALDAIDRTFVMSPVKYQIGQQRRTVGLYANAVEAYVEAGRGLEALLTADNSKSRILASLFARGLIPPPVAIPERLARSEQELAQRLAKGDVIALGLRGASLSPMEQTAINIVQKERPATVAELVKLWQEIESYGHSAEDYVSLRRGDRLKNDDVAELLEQLGPDTAIVSLFITGNRTLLFIMRAGEKAPHVVDIPLGDAGWNDLINDFAASLDKRTLRDGGNSLSGCGWAKPLEQLLKGAAPLLDGVKHIVVVPEASGYLLPWGLLGELSGWRGSVSTIPSIGYFRSVLKRPPEVRDGKLIVANPKLSGAKEEAKSVATTLDVEPLSWDEATKLEIMMRLGIADIVHIASHAHFNEGSPLDSGIKLKDGLLTARDILKQGLQAPSFIGLSACQTGMTGTLGGNELAGLSQALLYAGSSSVLASLWKVDSEATTYLMKQFYQKWRHDRLDKAAALQLASKETSTFKREWSDPFYWGAFVLMGNWH